MPPEAIALQNAIVNAELAGFARLAGALRQLFITEFSDLKP